MAPLHLTLEAKLDVFGSHLPEIFVKLHTFAQVKRPLRAIIGYGPAFCQVGLNFGCGHFAIFNRKAR
jgi:hypothetical protein